MAEPIVPRAYDINGDAADARQFVAVACDPRRSVVVQACAGSGKTWLLVARVLRLLLAGAAPSEILAITFTRKAAQEMRERLMQLLRDLALSPDADVRELLLERGVAQQELPGSIALARGLFERVLSSPQSLSIDTFHSWFGRLIKIAPMTAGVPHGYALTEATGELLNEAYNRFMQALNEPRHDKAKQALVVLYQMAGDWTTRKLLQAFVAKRAEWWAAVQSGELRGDTPLDWLRRLCGEDGERDARPTLWDDDRLLVRIRNIVWLLGQGAKRNLERATAIEAALTAGPDCAAFVLLLTQFCDDNGAPRGNDHRRGKLADAIAEHLGEQAAETFEREFQAVGTALLQLQRRSFEPAVLALNQALFAVGDAYLERYQELKAEQRVFDFSDLEWHAYRLLTDSDHAAYLHSRLDTRYKHILLDEFQDTNPLQWSIVRAWLDAYGDDAGRPSVFIVGDPKQSIYRFRRAEPRVFDAASALLAAQGADILRTNQTRRNATAVVDALNENFSGNAIFSPQTTLSTQQGAVWRLPLVLSEKSDAADAGGFMLRDPLHTPAQEEEDARRLQEGRAVARALAAARSQYGLRWADAMLLVKKRAHLSAYERALREAGIPFMSDKKGGLLQSLEIADLIALLSFLMTPGDSLALAHVLKCPIIGAADGDLVMLAQRGEPTWWQRLQAVVADRASESLQRALRLLQQWLHAAPHLPVHDLLDRILHEGELIARYAQNTPAAMRGQVIGNIEAFIELALNLDAGRYPSLPKFIDALRTLQNGADNEAPDEAAVDVATDAVRILTIHSAKGLEAEIVVLLDANHSKPANDDVGMLCDWPQDADAPTHFSAFGRTSERGTVRDSLFGAEQRFKEQEDWNLLYVAVTRARQLLIVSGVAAAKNTQADGIADGSWYQRLQRVQQIQYDALPNAAPVAPEEKFMLPLFDPPVLHASAGAVPRVGSDAAEEGIALHAAMERLTHAHRQAHTWPVRVPAAEAIARWLPCSRVVADAVHAQLHAILSQPALERFFNPAHYLAARNEMDVVVNDELLRFDRVVVFDDAVWVLDYKRNVLDGEHAAHRAQLARYRAAAQMVFPDKILKTALITVDGRLWEMD